MIKLIVYYTMFVICYVQGDVMWKYPNRILLNSPTGTLETSVNLPNHIAFPLIKLC